MKLIDLLDSNSISPSPSGGGAKVLKNAGRIYYDNDLSNYAIVLSKEAKDLIIDISQSNHDGVFPATVFQIMVPGESSSDPDVPYLMSVLSTSVYSGTDPDYPSTTYKGRTIYLHAGGLLSLGALGVLVIDVCVYYEGEEESDTYWNPWLDYDGGSRSFEFNTDDYTPEDSSDEEVEDDNLPLDPNPQPENPNL